MFKGNGLLIFVILLTLAAITIVIVKYIQFLGEGKSNEQLQANDSVIINNSNTGNPPLPPVTTNAIKAGDIIYATKDKLSYVDNNLSVAKIVHKFKSGEYLGTVESITNSGLGYWVNNYSYVCTVADGSNYQTIPTNSHCVVKPNKLWITSYDVEKR